MSLLQGRISTLGAVKVGELAVGERPRQADASDLRPGRSPAGEKLGQQERTDRIL